MSNFSAFTDDGDPIRGSNFGRLFLLAEAKVNHDVSALICNYTFPAKLALPETNTLPCSKFYLDKSAFERVDMLKFIDCLYYDIAMPLMDSFQKTLIGQNIDEQAEFNNGTEEKKLEMTDRYIQQYYYYQDCFAADAYYSHVRLTPERAAFGDIVAIGSIPDIAEDLKTVIKSTFSDKHRDWVAAFNPQLIAKSGDEICLSTDGKLLIPSDAVKGFAFHVLDCVIEDLKETICALTIHGSVAEVLQQRKPFSALIKRVPASEARSFNRFINYRVLTLPSPSS